MAKIVSSSHLSAAVIKANDHLCFYRMGGQWQVRMKSSLSGKRVKKDPAFRLTMVYAGLLTQASRIASQAFQQIPKEDRVKGLYKRMVSVAMKSLKSGEETEVAKETLVVRFLTPVLPGLIRSVKTIRSASDLLQKSRSAAKPQQKVFVENLRRPMAVNILYNRRDLLLTG